MNQVLIRFSFVLTLVLCYSSITFAQRVWSGQMITIAGTGDYLIEECSDTLILDTLWTAYLQRFSYDGSTWTDGTDYTAYISEIDQQVLLRYDNFWPNRRVLYDYSLELNDTFFMSQHGLTPFVVVEVDSQFIAGKIRKTLLLDHISEGYQDLWIEGIGSAYNHYLSPGEHPNMVDAGSELSCFQMAPNAQLWYATNPPHVCHVEDVERICDANAATKEMDKGGMLLLYPNPTDGNFKVVAEEVIIGYFIYDINGTLIAHSRLDHHDADLTSIVRMLDSGIYFIGLQFENMYLNARFVRL